VNNAPVRRGHGVHGDGLATGCGLLRRSLRHRAHLSLAALPVLLDVHDDTAGIFKLPADNHVDHELESPKGLTTAPNDEASVLTLNIDDYRIIAAPVAPDGGSGLDADGVEDVVDDIQRRFCVRTTLTD
jgi:hypothetical protein